MKTIEKSVQDLDLENKLSLAMLVFCVVSFEKGL